MSDDSSNAAPAEGLVDINDDLDAFENEFFQRDSDGKIEVEEKSEDKDKEEDVETGDDLPATDDDTNAPEDEKPTGDEDETEGEADEPKPEEKPKSKTQKRIEKLLERERLANERANTLEARLAALETSKQEVANKETPSLREQLPDDAPNPDATDKDGNPIYPLGEFDKDYIRDITRYSVKKELAEAEALNNQRAHYARMAQAQKEISDGWLNRLEAFEEEAPDIRENISDLVDTFQGVEPAYGEYLASVIMANEHGPQIMNYLSQNIGEAQKIVASGPTAAILALGRIEASLTPKQEEKRNKKPSSAPKPPETRARGSGAKTSTAGDTDDLDAFEKVFFKS